tara:strand:+ start:6332 stop:6952 length:621 start_codon:yes stop_codon:yes gene_type:complete
MHSTDDGNPRKSQFQKRHPGLTGIVYIDDDQSFRARARRHLRNPPMRTIALIVFAIVAIPSILIYPRVSGIANENWSNLQLARERHFVNVTAASWIYPFLRRQAHRMQEAELPNEWRSVSFQHGPCLPSHMDQLPVGKYSYAIEQACLRLDEIQMKYAADCATTADCNIREEAVLDLQVVLDRLRVAFSDANLAPLTSDDHGQVRD